MGAATKENRILGRGLAAALDGNAGCGTLSPPLPALRAARAGNQGSAHGAAPYSARRGAAAGAALRPYAGPSRAVRSKGPCGHTPGQLPSTGGGSDAGRMRPAAGAFQAMCGEYGRRHAGREHVPVRVPSPGQHGAVRRHSVPAAGGRERLYHAKVACCPPVGQGRQRTCRGRIQCHLTTPSVALLVPGVPGSIVNVRARGIILSR